MDVIKQFNQALREVGVIATEREARGIWYALAHEGLDVFQWEKWQIIYLAEAQERLMKQVADESM